MNKDNGLNSKEIARNTLYNLSGFAVPLIFAAIFIPPLIHGLGDEKFGLLALSWIFIGYSSFFDLGMGRGLTKIVSERIGSDKNDSIPKLFWTSLFIIIILSIVLALILIVFLPYIIAHQLNLSINVQEEVYDTFFVLVMSIPIISSTAVLKGFLEAYQSFGIINIIKSFLGALTFTGPFIVLWFTRSLFWIIIFLICTRGLIWLLYFINCLKINSKLKNKIDFDINAVKPLIKFSLWITAANILGPIILYADRIFISLSISAQAITYYVAPYEMVTKVLVFSTAVSGVLFPVFSAGSTNNSKFSIRYFNVAMKFIFLILFPIILLIVVYSYEIIELWLGSKFAENSSIVLKFLAIGVLMNSLASIPESFFQGIGKPIITTLIYLIELPLLMIAMWFFVDLYGINGIAMVWMIAASLSAIVYFALTLRLYNVEILNDNSKYFFSLLILLLIAHLFIHLLIFKIISSFITLIIYFYSAKYFFLSYEEKLYIKNILTSVKSRLIKIS